MALTINQQPSAFKIQPAQNSIEYLVDSTQTAQTNFKLNCKVVYDGSVIATIKKPVEYGTTKCIIDIGDIVRNKNYEAYPYFLTSGTASTITQLKEWNCVFQEYYGTTPALTGTAASGTAFSTFQGDFRYKEWASNDWRDYIFLAGQNKKFLTNYENYLTRNIFDAVGDFQQITASSPFRKIRSSQSVYVCGITDDSASGSICVGLWDSSYTLIDYKTLTSSALANNPHRVDFRIKPSALVSDYSFTAQEVLDAKYMSVYFYVPTNYVLSEEFIFEIDNCTLPKWGSTYELMWLNREGGWDSHIFTGKYKRFSTSEKQFLKNDITRRISGTSIVNDAYARRKKQFHTGVIERYTISEGSMSATDYNGIEDLIHSSNVLWYDSGTWRAVNIIESDYEGKIGRIDKQLNLQITFEVDMNNTLQAW